MKRSCAVAALAGWLVASLVPLAAGATAPRTFVSVTGSDTSPCSVASPCRSFAAAIAQTAVDGEVIVLDSGGYGPFAISQSVSIVAPPGVYAGISVSSSAAINITGTGTHAVLRGLTLESFGAFIGVQVQAPDNANVLIDRCVLRGFTYGLFAWGANLQLVVRDTEVLRNTYGIALLNGAHALLERVSVRDSTHEAIALRSQFPTGNTIDVTLRDSELRANERGILADNTLDAGSRDLMLLVERTLIAGHPSDAVSLTTQGSSTARIAVVGSVLVDNLGYGIHAHCVVAGNGGTTNAVVSDTTITDHGGAAIIITGGAVCKASAGRNTLARNNVGLYNGTAGTFVSFGNNQLVDNVAPTFGAISTLAPQ